MRPHHKDGLNTDQTGKPVIISESSIYVWHESHKEFGGQGDGVPKACQKQAAADSRGSRTCVCASTFIFGCGTRREGRMN